MNTEETFIKQNYSQKCKMYFKFEGYSLLKLRYSILTF